PDNKTTPYNSIGQNYNKYRQADQRLVKTICTLLPSISQSPAIMEIGTGTGNYSLSLAKKGYSILALEPSHIMRSQAEAHKNIYWLPYSLDECRKENNNIDALLSVMVIHHLNPIETAL